MSGPLSGGVCCRGRALAWTEASGGEGLLNVPRRFRLRRTPHWGGAPTKRPAPCKGLRPLTHFGACLLSFPLRGSRGVTDAPRRARAATPAGVVRPPCGARRITAAPLCSVGDEGLCTLLRALWLESVSGAHRVLASPELVFFLDVEGGGRISGSKTPCGGVRDLLPLMGVACCRTHLPSRRLCATAHTTYKGSGMPRLR